MYRATVSWPRNQLEVSGQHHTPAPLAPAISAAVSSGRAHRNNRQHRVIMSLSLSIPKSFIFPLFMEHDVQNSDTRTKIRVARNLKKSHSISGPTENTISWYRSVKPSRINVDHSSLYIPNSYFFLPFLHFLPFYFCLLLPVSSSSISVRVLSTIQFPFAPHTEVSETVSVYLFKIYI
jgi:hypothetical protein